MELDEIRYKIACGELTAMQAFTQMKQHIPPAGSGATTKDLRKKIVTEFFYWWSNHPGTNTEQGFETWWALNRKRFDLPSAPAPTCADTTECENHGVDVPEDCKKYQCRKIPSEIDTLLADLLPEMEARVKGLQMLWPGEEVLTVLHRNEELVLRIKRAIK